MDAIHKRGGLAEGDPELVLFLTRGNVCVCLGIHIRVETEGDLGAAAELLCVELDAVDFTLTLDVEDADIGFEGFLDFPILFADSCEDKVGGVSPCAKGAFEFPATDKVETGPALPEEAEDRAVAVGLNSVADARIETREGLF